MALNNKQGTQTKQVVYATDEAGMMKDAKEYAKRDFTVVKETLKLLEVSITEEAIAEALIQVKYNQIKEARCNRVTYFD